MFLVPYAKGAAVSATSFVGIATAPVASAALFAMGREKSCRLNRWLEIAASAPRSAMTYSRPTIDFERIARLRLSMRAARLVLVHDDTDFREPAVAALRAAGYDVAAYSSSLAALDAFEAPASVQLLITRMSFPLGSPHGASLASMARRRIPDLKVLFVARPEWREHTEGIGQFMTAPVSLPELVDRVSAMLAG
jgi:CheY-like chemotaxis protein